jgi:RNA-binding protein
MSDPDLQRAIHDLDVTVQVGKGGIDSVADEFRDQLDERDLVKVKFLRSARGASETEELATDLGESADAELLQTRGHTAVYRR